MDCFTKDAAPHMSVNFVTCYLQSRCRTLAEPIAAFCNWASVRFNFI